MNYIWNMFGYKDYQPPQNTSQKTKDQRTQNASRVARQALQKKTDSAEQKAEAALKEAQIARREAEEAKKENQILKERIEELISAQQQDSFLGQLDGSFYPVDLKSIPSGRASPVPSAPHHSPETIRDGIVITCDLTDVQIKKAFFEFNSNSKKTQKLPALRLVDPNKMSQEQIETLRDTVLGQYKQGIEVLTVVSSSKLENGKLDMLMGISNSIEEQPC